MKWFLYVVLGILALNLLVIVMVGIVLLSDWIRGKGRKPSKPQVTPKARFPSDGGPAREDSSP